MDAKFPGEVVEVGHGHESLPRCRRSRRVGPHASFPAHVLRIDYDAPAGLWTISAHAIGTS